MASTTLGAYAELVRAGFGASEATQMTALAFGLSVHDCRWTIDQINSVLFLAELRRRGHFGAHDGDHDQTASGSEELSIENPIATTHGHPTLDDTWDR